MVSWMMKGGGKHKTCEIKKNENLPSNCEIWSNIDFFKKAVLERTLSLRYFLAAITYCCSLAFEQHDSLVGSLDGSKQILISLSTSKRKWYLLYWC